MSQAKKNDPCIYSPYPSRRHSIGIGEYNIDQVGQMRCSHGNCAAKLGKAPESQIHSGQRKVNRMGQKPSPVDNVAGGWPCLMLVSMFATAVIALGVAIGFIV